MTGAGPAAGGRRGGTRVGDGGGHGGAAGRRGCGAAPFSFSFLGAAPAEPQARGQLLFGRSPPDRGRGQDEGGRAAAGAGRVGADESRAVGGVRGGHRRLPSHPPPFPEPPRAGPGAEAAPRCGGPPAAAPLQAARRGLQSAAGALSAPGLPRPRCCPARGVVKGKRLRGGPAGPAAPQARFCLSRGFGFCFPRRFGSKRRVRGSGFLVPSELSRLRRVAVVRLRGSAVPGLFICSPNVHSRNRPPPTAPLLLAIVCLAYVRHNNPSRFFFPP